MADMINQLLAANASRNTSLPNPAAMMAVGQRGMSSGFDKLQTVGKQIKQNRIDSDIGTAISGIGDTSTMSPTQYQDALFQSIGKVDGVSAMDAIGFATKLSQPRFDERKYGDDRTDANNLNSYRDTMSGRGSYGMTTDDYGNAYMLNKHTGEYEQVATGNSNKVNPKNIVLKSITDRDASGVETTTQVPFDKTTGQPVNVDNYDFSGANAGYENAEGVRVDANGRPLAVQPSEGVKYPIVDKSTRESKDALQSSYDLINGINVPTANQSGPFDARVDDVMSWLNVDTDDAVASRDFDAEVANLTTAFGTAQVKGVLSDKDTKFITDQMPDRKLSPTVNANRINSIKGKIREAMDRFNVANPHNKIDMHSDLNKTIDKTKGSSYGAGTEIISF